MTLLDPSNPERYKTLAHPSVERPTHLFKIFEDPDFIQMDLSEKRDFYIRWASNANNVQSLELLDEIIEQADFESGTITLRHTFERPGMVIGGANILSGDAEDIANEVRDAGDRVIGYSLSNKSLELRFGPSWPKTYHDIATNELMIKMRRSDKMARFIIDQSISLTAMEGLKRSTDQTLDEFAKYLPALQS